MLPSFIYQARLRRDLYFHSLTDLELRAGMIFSQYVAFIKIFSIPTTIPLSRAR